jgi:hypothetical protein
MLPVHRLALATSIVLLAGPLSAQICSNTSVGLTPINDLGTGTYAGFQGGLYSGGSNVVPPAHLASAMSEAAAVVPLDAAGNPAPTGRIVFLSIGMSNTRNEWDEFMPLTAVDPIKDPHVQVVQGAQGGQAANVINTPTATYWTWLDGQVAAAGATNAQVQVVWLKEAHSSPTDPFPTEALRLRDDLTIILGILKDKFPNLRLAYLSSRIYAGYATGALNPESYAYESGFAVKWTIEDQIAGNPALNWNPGAGPVEAPLLLWGPYTWADGLVPRSDGLIWQCSDYASDGTHPNPVGSLKVANMLLDMCHLDPTAVEWYVGTPVTIPDSYCAGDALDALVLISCPCNNVGTLGHGCGNSFDPGGALLVKSGTTNPDTIVLAASGMPLAASSLFLKSDASQPSGIAFGDGLRCVDGAIVRLGLRVNQNGASQYPGPGNPPVSQRGNTPPGSGLTGHYQTYYRNAAAFCTQATFNITNALRITW